MAEKAVLKKLATLVIVSSASELLKEFRISKPSARAARFPEKKNVLRHFKHDPEVIIQVMRTDGKVVLQKAVLHRHRSFWQRVIVNMCESLFQNVSYSGKKEK